MLVFYMGDIFLQQHNRIEREREREGEKNELILFIL